MKSKELAEQLDGIEYASLVGFCSDFKYLFENARDHGLVIVFGASDDLMEFRGAIDDEAGCYDGGTVFFDENGLVEEGETENVIEAFWCINDIPFTYETDIPHENFNVMENGRLYCIGIVFSLDDLS